MCARRVRARAIEPRSVGAHANLSSVAVVCSTSSVFTGVGVAGDSGGDGWLAAVSGEGSLILSPG